MSQDVHFSFTETQVERLKEKFSSELNMEFDQGFWERKIKEAFLYLKTEGSDYSQASYAILYKDGPTERIPFGACHGKLRYRGKDAVFIVNKLTNQHDICEDFLSWVINQSHCSDMYYCKDVEFLKSTGYVVDGFWNKTKTLNAFHLMRWHIDFRNALDTAECLVKEYKASWLTAYVLSHFIKINSLDEVFFLEPYSRDHTSIGPLTTIEAFRNMYNKSFPKEGQNLLVHEANTWRGAETSWGPILATQISSFIKTFCQESSETPHIFQSLIDIEFSSKKLPLALKEDKLKALVAQANKGEL